MVSFFTTTSLPVYAPMLSWILPFVILHAYACLGASFKEVTPPDTMIYSYPIIDVPIGQKITLGMDGGAIEVPTNYHGLGWNMSSSITFPNGSTIVLASTGNMFDTGVSSHCLGSGGIRRPTNALVVGAALTPDVAGKHIAGWNVVYGTTDDPTVANETSCDISRLSLQTFHFNASFNVVEAQNSTFYADYITVTTDFPSEPTGKFFETGGAQTTSVVLGGLIGVVAVTIGRLI